MPKAFFILGAPRCGTSLIAGILHRSGISAGDKFISHEHANPTGFYEDYLLATINTGLLKSAGGSHILPPALSEIRKTATKPIEVESQFGVGGTGVTAAAQYLAWRNNAGKDWCMKDPRVILTWPIWAQALSRDFDLHFIVTHRNVWSSAQSWVATDYMKDPEYAMGVILEYVYRLSAITWLADQKYPTLRLAFEQWWRDPQPQKDALEQFTGHTLDFSHFEEKLWRS